jgi:hypothetical protein
VTITTLTDHRVYFVDGPAAGKSMLTTPSGPRLSWDDEHGTAHAYRRVTRFRGTHFYRHGA